MNRRRAILIGMIFLAVAQPDAMAPVQSAPGSARAMLIGNWKLVSYLGYFGPFTVNEQLGTVTHHVAGSSYPHWVGGDQVRHYAFSRNGRRLTLSVKNGDRVAQSLDWDRVE